MLCGYCNHALTYARPHKRSIEPPVMLCGYCNKTTTRSCRPNRGIEPPVMLCGYCNASARVDGVPTPPH